MPDGRQGQLHARRRLRAGAGHRAGGRRALAGRRPGWAEGDGALPGLHPGIGGGAEPRRTGQVPGRGRRQGQRDRDRSEQPAAGAAELPDQARHADQAGQLGGAQDAGADRHRLCRAQRRQRSGGASACRHQRRTADDPVQALAVRPAGKRVDQRVVQCRPRVEQPERGVRRRQPCRAENHAGRHRGAAAQPGRAARHDQRRAGRRRAHRQVSRPGGRATGADAGAHRHQRGGRRAHGRQRRRCQHAGRADRAGRHPDRRGGHPRRAAAGQRNPARAGTHDVRTERPVGLAAPLE